MGDHSRVGDDFPDDYEPQENPVNLRHEPALAAISLLAPAVGTLLLFFADLDPASQAAWNGAALAVAGLITALVVDREKLAPAILGFAGALLSLLTVFGFGMSAEQSTGVMAFLSLAVGAYVRTQVVAPVERAAAV